jgi:hypothetical protein
LCDFPHTFLRIALAKCGLPRGVRFFYRSRREILAHGKQRDLRRIASRNARCMPNAVVYGLQVGGDCVHTRHDLGPTANFQINILESSLQVTREHELLRGKL